MKKNNCISVMLIFGGNKGTHVSGAGVYLETGTNHNPVAFQETGESGKVTFAYLDKGVYRILLDIPRQKGKLEAKEPWSGDVQVAYHSDKKLFLFHEPTGFFSVRFSKFSNLAHSNITPMHELDDARANTRIVICKFEVDQKFGSITLELSAHSQNKFHKMTAKYKNDAGMSLIRKSG